jgi:hypothetical protein
MSRTYCFNGGENPLPTWSQYIRWHPYPIEAICSNQILLIDEDLEMILVLVIWLFAITFQVKIENHNKPERLVVPLL